MTSMASAERDPVMRVWGSAPSGVHKAELLQVGVRGLRPLKLKAFIAFACPKEAANLTNYVHAELHKLGFRTAQINNFA